MSESPGARPDRGQPLSPTQVAAAAAARQALAYRLLGAGCALVGVLLVIGGMLALRGKPAASPGGAQSGTSTINSQAATGPGIPSSSAARPATPAVPGPTTPRRPSSPSPHPTGGAGQPTSQVPLTVLNNTTRPDLAEQAAQQFRAAGWQVVKVGNFTGKIPATTVYYTPGNASEQRAARALAKQFPRIGRVLPHYAGLPSSVHGVIVVLAPDW